MASRVPALARTKAATARLWTYVGDDRPFARPVPLAALFLYSRDQRGEHPQVHLGTSHQPADLKG
jgi:transposase